MTQRRYRTAQGRNIDLGALMLKNENVRAVGNLPVNARGDYVDADNRPVQTKPQQVTRQNRRQVTNVTDEPVALTPRTDAEHSKKTTRKAKVAEQDQSAAEATESADQADAVDAGSEAAESTADLGGGGLAAAIARARHIQQEPMLDPRSKAKQRPGVNRI